MDVADLVHTAPSRLARAAQGIAGRVLLLAVGLRALRGVAALETPPQGQRRGVLTISILAEPGSKRIWASPLSSCTRTCAIFCSNVNSRSP